MSLDICKYPWYYQHNQNNRHIQHLPVFLCPFVFLFCMCVCVVRTLNMRPALSTNFDVHTTTLLTTGSMLYSRSLWLTHRVQLKLHPQNNNSTFPPLWVLYVLTYIVFKTTSSRRYHYYAYFISQDTKAQPVICPWYEPTQVSRIL